MSKQNHGCLSPPLIALALCFINLQPMVACSVALPTEFAVIDKFRPPDCVWCMGNRGIEYRTLRGVAVKATVGGTVSFVGMVANTMYVVLRTTDGLLVTHGRLWSAQVRLGDEVQLGQQLGEAGDALYIGVRRAGRYLDPAQCSGNGHRQIRAVLL